jgi:hypothetical protein
MIPKKVKSLDNNLGIEKVTSDRVQKYLMLFKYLKQLPGPLPKTGHFIS